MTRAAPNASHTPGHLHTYKHTFKSHKNPTTAHKELFFAPTCQLFSLRAADGSSTAIPPRLPRLRPPLQTALQPLAGANPAPSHLCWDSGTTIASGNHQGNSVCTVKSGASHPPSLLQCPNFVKSLPEWKCLVCGQTVTGTAASSAKEWRKGYLHQDISYAQRFRHCRALGSLTYLHDLLVEGNPLLVETLDPGLCCESVLVLFIERREMFCVTCLVIFFWVVFSCKINNHLSAYPFLSPPKHFSLYSHLHKHRIQRRIKGFAVSSHKRIAEYRTTPRGFRKESTTGLWGKLSHDFLSAGCPMLWNSQ